MRLKTPREVLLVEVDRWCRGAACGARTRVPLTKEEARSYTGFECGRCGRKNPDALAERDIPEWWEELKITSLDGVRERPRQGGEDEGPGEVIGRMSEAWKRLGEGRGGGDSF